MAKASAGLEPGGYPLDIFKETKFDHKYVCNYCSRVLRDPVQIFCGHRFCRSCIESHVSSGERCKQCDREGITDDYSIITTDQMFPDNAVKREMYKLPVTCPNPGCPWNGIFKEFEGHFLECSFRQGKCQECGNLIAVKDFEHHKLKDCPQRLVRCQMCNGQVRYCEIENHDTECPKAIVKCPVCGRENRRENLDHHMQTECTSVRCPAGCGDPVDKNRVGEHIDSSALSRHLIPVVTQMSTVGADMQQVKALIEEKARQILEISDKTTAIEQQLVDVMNQPRPAAAAGGGEGVLGGQVSIDQKVRQAMEIQQGSNNEKFQQLEVKVGTFEGIVSALHREIDKAITAVEKIEMHRRAMKETVEQNQQKIRTLERTIAVKDVAIAELELRVQSLESASYDGTFIWKVPEFTKKQQDAIQSRSISIYSPPFYTSRRGYKMCARLYPNGDGMGKGSHLSVFFVVMRGPYDALQTWPFKQRVTFCLINQSGKEHVLDSFRPDPSSTSFKRPTSDMNIASGCPLFLRLENVQSSVNGFLKDDTLFLKVMVDMNDPPLSEPMLKVEDRIHVEEISTGATA